MSEATRIMRTMPTKFDVREVGGEQPEMRIEGYFAVFDGIYEIADGMTESIDSGAFDEAISGDIRALADHDTRLVLGRTTAHTLELKVDAHGLWGSILVNPKDQDAVNLYERVKRGDVNQCSFGFDVIEQDTEVRDDGSIHWTIRKVKLYEVSVCTFPAYETTEVTARCSEAKDIKRKTFEGWKEKITSQHEWLKGGNNEAESPDAGEED